MALEIMVETTSATDIDVQVEAVGNVNIEIDIFHTGPQGAASVEDQDQNLLAELLPGDKYIATVFDTLQQRILSPVPLTITQNILD